MKAKSTPDMRITKDVLHAIKGTIGKRPAEQGGILGSSDGGETIDHYYFDEHAGTSAGTYSPNTEYINRVVLPGWEERGISPVGFVHSHPRGVRHPSQGDKEYAAPLMDAMGVERLALPIVQSGKSSKYELLGYFAQSSDDEVQVTPANIVPVSAELPPSDLSCSETPEFHSRVEEEYPLNVMRRKRLIVIGCGGAGEYIEAMARTGIGKIDIFDGDTYSETNLATQSCYRDEIGMNKADATAMRVRRIDPEIDLNPVPRFLDKNMTDQDFLALLGDASRYAAKDILVAACTDNFFAQDRAMRLALKYGMPFMAAQLYAGGQAGEVLFTYPGVTPSCPRCLLADRYDAYLREGYENQVGSHQSPIFATQRINALKGFVSLMLLLYGENCSPFDSLLDEVATRNFLQVRMYPESPVDTLFDRHLGTSPYSFFDETLWLTQTPDNGMNGARLCPECHGWGNLQLLVNSVYDTRIMPFNGGDGRDH